MKPSSQILLPAADRRWELWKLNGGGFSSSAAGDTASALAAATDEVIVGLPGSHCRTVALSLPEAEGEELDAMVRSQLEKRGLATAGGTDTRFATHQLVRDAGSTVVSVDVLDPDLPEDCCLPGASTYLPSARLLPLPPGKLVVYPEYGRLVLAAGRGDKLLHSHVIGVGHELPPDSAQQLRATQLALEARGLSGKFSGIELWGDFDPATAEALSLQTGLPVSIAPRPAPTTRAVRELGGALLPDAVRQQQARRARQHRLLRLLALGCLAYLLAATAAWFYLRSLNARAKDLGAEVAESAPGAAEVKATAGTWGNLRPAIDPQRYPLIVLNEFTRVMPPGGVVVTELAARPDQISIEGLAKDAQAAFQLLEDVQKSKMLNAFTWSMGQPRMNENNSARFDIVGKIAD